MSQKNNIFKGHNALDFWELDHSIKSLMDKKTVAIERPDNPSVGEELRADFEKVGEMLMNPEGITPFKRLLYGRKRAFNPGQLLFFIDENRDFFPHGLEKMECEGNLLVMKIRKKTLVQWRSGSSWHLRALSMLLKENCSIQLESPRRKERSNPEG